MPVIDAIKTAAKNRVLLQIVYIDVKGKKTIRNTEPYEIRDDYYYGFDVDKQEIRKFKLTQIASVKITTMSYIPRWQVLI